MHSPWLAQHRAHPQMFSQQNVHSQLHEGGEEEEEEEEAIKFRQRGSERCTRLRGGLGSSAHRRGSA
jgi:hypothetical protein